ncbi:oligopeptide transporter [Polychaeton citri CBS 116435]|uniref:Oligopeptide transporter n=1 Tax=Polychaeton citri CBS 116435 TaxID=1314669 RepID=A0A9P4QCC4_9PEZI|nr:oligopeptide transporter [Polychaeton citri CBS 116435]
MSGLTEVIDHGVDPMGHINPDVPPTTQKQNVFNKAFPDDKKSLDSSEQEVTEKTANAYASEIDADSEDVINIDPYVPFDDLPPEDRRIVTIRAMIVGCACGAAVNTSNLYLGLKTGWTFGANLFGSIVGFSVLKSLSKALPEGFPILGGSFGPKENNIVQTAAMAAGGLSNVFVSGVPALYQLKLLSDNPKDDFPRLITMTLVGGFFGFAMATPLRKFFIVYVARELRLIFPTPSAVAMTIRSMHGAANGEAVAKMKMKALSIAFSLALILRVVSQYAIGILWDWHVFTWFYIWGNNKNHAIDAENWGWIIEFTPAFIGAGILVGLNTSISFFMGSVLAWGLIGPTLVATGTAFGTSIGRAIEDPNWYDYMNYASLGAAASSKTHPSPRYWMLWPGILGMVCISFTELALQYKIIFFVFRAVYRACCAQGAALLKKEYKDKNHQSEEDVVQDSAAPHEQVKWIYWLPLLIITVIFWCVVMGVQFDLPVGMSILTIVLAFIFTFLAIQCTGVTDITPLTAASKASQIVLGGATKGEHWTTAHAQRLNLLGGSVANIGANQASDLVSDFRTGFLLRTPPNQQWIAQGLGTIVAVFLAPALFILFTKAYPCVIDIDAETCAFSAPSVSAWRAVAVAMTDSTFPVPKSSGIFAIVFSIFGVIMTIIRHYAYKGKYAKYREFHPNMMVITFAFLLPQTQYGTAMCIGSIASYFWMKKNPKHFDIYGYAVAAGLIAGEGIGGVVNAIFQVAGIAGPDPYGTTIACPAGLC